MQLTYFASYRLKDIDCREEYNSVSYKMLLALQKFKLTTCQEFHRDFLS